MGGKVRLREDIKLHARRVWTLFFGSLEENIRPI